MKKRVVLAAFVTLALASGLMAQDSLKVNALNPAAGATSIYQVSFVTADTLYPDAQITLTFPEAFDLSKVVMANSTSINGGFKVEVNQNSVVLRRTGLGRPIMPGEAVEVKFANVVNPKEFDGEFNLQVEIRKAAASQSQTEVRSAETALVLRPVRSKPRP